LNVDLHGRHQQHGARYAQSGDVTACGYVAQNPCINERQIRLRRALPPESRPPAGVSPGWEDEPRPRNVLALQRMLGHTSAKVTLDTYADLFDTDLDAVAATLNTAYSRRIVGKKWADPLADPGL
jgi:hypothetical protein